MDKHINLHAIKCALLQYVNLSVYFLFAQELHRLFGPPLGPFDFKHPADTGLTKTLYSKLVDIVIKAGGRSLPKGPNYTGGSASKEVLEQLK